MAIKFYSRTDLDYEEFFRESGSDGAEEVVSVIRISNRSGKILDVHEFFHDADTDEISAILPPGTETFWDARSSFQVFRVVSRDGSINFKFSGFGTVVVPESGIPYEYAYATNENGWSVDFGWGVPDLVRALALDLNGAAPEKLPASEFNNNRSLNLFNALEAWKAGFDGTGVKIAILDSGIVEHAEIDGVVHERDVVADDGEATPEEEELAREHGLRVASVIAANNDLGEAGPEAPDITGVAPNAEIIDVKVLADDLAESETIAAGIRYAVDRGARIIQLSLGAGQYVQDHEVNSAVEYAVERNVLLVFAAGNESAKEPWGLHLIALEHPVAIGGELTGNTLIPSIVTNLAGTLEHYFFMAPTGGYYPSDDGDYGELRPGKGGTSYASPYISGIAALVIQKYPDISLVDLLEKLKESSRIPGMAEEAGPSGINRIAWNGELHVEGTEAIDIVFFDLPGDEAREVPGSSRAPWKIEFGTSDGGTGHIEIASSIEEIRFSDGTAARPVSSSVIDDSLELIFACTGAELLNDRVTVGRVVNIVESRDKADLLDYVNGLLFPGAEDFMPSILLAVENVWGMKGDGVEDLIGDILSATGAGQEEFFWKIAESGTVDELIDAIGQFENLVFYSIDGGL